MSHMVHHKYAIEQWRSKWFTSSLHPYTYNTNLFIFLYEVPTARFHLSLFSSIWSPSSTTYPFHPVVGLHTLLSLRQKHIHSTVFLLITDLRIIFRLLSSSSWRILGSGPQQIGKRPLELTSMNWTVKCSFPNPPIDTWWSWSSKADGGGRVADFVLTGGVQQQGALLVLQQYKKPGFRYWESHCNCGPRRYSKKLGNCMEDGLRQKKKPNSKSPKVS